jgi:Na+/H+ antiporter NhaA
MEISRLERLQRSRRRRVLYAMLVGATVWVSLLASAWAATHAAVSLPAGTPVSVKLGTTLKTDKTPQGLRFATSLLHDVKDSTGRYTILPEGSLVEGVITFARGYSWTCCECGCRSSNSRLGPRYPMVSA